MTSTKQDLVFFKDNTLIPEILLTSDSSHLCIISHVQGTSATWLINSLIENSLVGTASLINNDLTRKTQNRSRVCFVSFRNSADFYAKNCKKNGLDLDMMDNFTFIDCFTELFTKTVKTPTNASSEVNALFDAIIKISKSSHIIFIEAPELLLLATSISSNELSSHFIRLNKSCKQLYVISNQDSPQFIDANSTNPQDPAFKVTDFLTKLYHRSQLNLQLNPLSTGRANDISGSLSISNGGVPYDLPISVVENEYIYHITKDSNIKLFFR